MMGTTGIAIILFFIELELTNIAHALNNLNKTLKAGVKNDN